MKGNFRNAYGTQKLSKNSSSNKFKLYIYTLGEIEKATFYTCYRVVF